MDKLKSKQDSSFVDGDNDLFEVLQQNALMVFGQ